jgi:hypothetical protein
MKYYRNPNPRPKNRVFEIEETHGAGPRTWQAYGEATVATVDGYKVAYLSRSFSNEQGQAGRDIPLNQATRFYALKADGTPDLDAYASKQSRGWSLTGCGEYGSGRVSNRPEALAYLAQVNLHDDRTGNPRSYPNISSARPQDFEDMTQEGRLITEPGYHKGLYYGDAGCVSYRIFKGPNGDWVADLESQYHESPWALAGLAPRHFKTMRLEDASERLLRIAKACETLEPGSRAHAISRTGNPPTGKKIRFSDDTYNWPWGRLDELRRKPTADRMATRNRSQGWQAEVEVREFKSRAEMLEFVEDANRNIGKKQGWGYDESVHWKPMLREPKPSDIGYRTGNPAASRFVLLDAGPSEGHHGAHDRYTLIDTLPYNEDGPSFREPRFGDSYFYLGFGPGVSEHGEMTARDFHALKAERFRSLGKRIKIESLPANLRRLAEQFIADSPESTR